MANDLEDSDMAIIRDAGLSSSELAKRLRRKQEEDEKEKRLKELIDAPQRKYIPD